MWIVTFPFILFYSFKYPLLTRSAIKKMYCFPIVPPLAAYGRRVADPYNKQNFIGAKLPAH